MKLEIKFRGFEPDVKVTKYVEKKIGGLVRFIPKAQREVAIGTVVLEEDPSGREQNRFVCDVIISLVGTEVVGHDATVNIYAAVDIVEAKIKTQLTEYKEKTSPKQSRMRRLRQWGNKLRRRREERLDEESANFEE